ncbi:hypothetical protein CK203_059131 [Vitis vinifera]|uniref:Reverse transcriptase/retrotransposon-derived protein RNase H-like domain-containing protein n=1 Tax=Vitis vinifera TaxID=29760 RepID=A0A438GCF6_VITVI|nr:hypothetical protein CK203_059131 [Vitis vinifera]
MVLRILQPRIARHVVGVPFADFGSLVLALYDVEDGISRGLWTDSSPSDVKGKKPFEGQRSIDVSAISSSSQRPPRASRGLLFHTRPRDSHDTLLKAILLDRHAVEPGSSEAHRGRIIDRSHFEATTLAFPPQFKMDLHCAYHQGPGHETDRCTALRHAIQDLIDQGLVHLGQPSVTQNPLPTYATHAVPPLAGGIHFLDFVDSDDYICMLSWDDTELAPKEASVQTTIVEPPTFMRYSVQTLFVWESLETTTSHRRQTIRGDICSEKVRAEDDEILRQLQSTQAHISIWSLLASFSTHRDALTRVLSQIRVDTTTTLEGLIHMMTAGRATCIIFSDDDLPLEGSDHTRPLYISTVRAYDSTRREVMGTLEIELLIAIPSSLHQKVKFIHEGQVVTIQSVGDVFISVEPVLQISHSDDDLLLTSTMVLDMMRDMSYLLGMGLGQRQHEPSKFMTIPDHDVPFGLEFIPTEVYYRYMARLRKERVRARLTHTPFDYLIRPCTMNLLDYFVRASEPLTHSDMIIGGLSTTQEAELQRLVHQLRLSDGALGMSTTTLIAPASPDHMSLMTLYFPDEIDEHRTFPEVGDIVDGAAPHDEYIDEMLALSLSQIEESVQPGLASPFDLFEVSAIEIAEEILTSPAPESGEDVMASSDLFDSHVGIVEGASDFVDPPSSFDILSGVSPAVGDTRLLIWHADQPRELRIGSDLSTDERDSLIQLLRSYLDVFAWSYEDMPGLDPSSSIVCHFCPMPDRGEYPEWLANVVPVPKKDGKSHAIRIEERRSHISESTTTLFHDMMHRDVEVYVDDMIVKSRDRSDHLAALERGIEVDPDKIRAILDMPAPRTERESQPTVWDDQCQRAFERIREYLLSPPVWRLLHQAVLYSYTCSFRRGLGCMLAQLDDSGKDRAIYYLSKRMLDYETRYVMIERYCLALTPLVGRLMRWLSIDDFPDEDVAAVTSLSGWRMYFDGAANHSGYGIGVLLISPHGDHIPRSVRLAFSDRHPATNNIVEYEACILGLETPLSSGLDRWRCLVTPIWY